MAFVDKDARRVLRHVFQRWNLMRGKNASMKTTLRSNVSQDILQSVGQPDRAVRRWNELCGRDKAFYAIPPV